MPPFNKKTFVTSRYLKKNPLPLLKHSHKIINPLRPPEHDVFYERPLKRPSCMVQICQSIILSVQKYFAFFLPSVIDVFAFEAIF
jgi:hypothetical protein